MYLGWDLVDETTEKRDARRELPEGQRLSAVTVGERDARLQRMSSSQRENSAERLQRGGKLGCK